MSIKSLFFNSLGTPHIVKRFMMLIGGLVSLPMFTKHNSFEIEGAEFLTGLSKKNVLIVSNHQTYYMDVFGLLQFLISYKNGYINEIGNSLVHLNPFVNIYFVAAEETMKNFGLSKILSLVGGISVKRTWRKEGENVERKVDLGEVDNIKLALSEGWVMTFPQGTTEPFAPARKGTAHIIIENQCTVLPIVLEGFSDAFKKRSFSLRKKGVKLKLRVKEPFVVNNADADKDLILAKIMDAIEQSDRFNPEKK